MIAPIRKTMIDGGAGELSGAPFFFLDGPADVVVKTFFAIEFLHY